MRSNVNLGRKSCNAVKKCMILMITCACVHKQEKGGVYTPCSNKFLGNNVLRPCTQLPVRINAVIPKRLLKHCNPIESRDTPTNVVLALTVSSLDIDLKCTIQETLRHAATEPSDCSFLRFAKTLMFHPSRKTI